MTVIAPGRIETRLTVPVGRQGRPSLGDSGAHICVRRCRDCGCQFEVSIAIDVALTPALFAETPRCAPCARRAPAVEELV